MRNVQTRSFQKMVMVLLLRPVHRIYILVLHHFLDNSTVSSVDWIYRRTNSAWKKWPCHYLVTFYGKSCVEMLVRKFADGAISGLFITSDFVFHFPHSNPEHSEIIAGFSFHLHFSKSCLNLIQDIVVLEIDVWSLVFKLEIYISVASADYSCILKFQVARESMERMERMERMAK